MTDHDRAAARRELADALQRALDRRHEVLDVIVESGDNASAVDAIAKLLGTSKLGGEAVMAISFAQLTKDSRRKIADELEDLNKQLSFTLGERPASSGESLALRTFSAGVDRNEQGLGRGQILQAVHPVGDADVALGGVAAGDIVPARPGAGASWHQAGVAMQPDVVRRVGKAAEQFALTGARIVEKRQRLVGVAGQHDIVEAVPLTRRIAHGHA